MLQRLRCAAFLVVFVGVFSSCRDAPTSSTASPLFDIDDGAHDGNIHFFFLPPMVPDPSPSGVFDGTLSPTIEICEWDEPGQSCVGSLVDVFTTGTGGGFIQVDDDAEAYHVPWHAGDAGLEVTKIYRIRVFVGSQELGHADVQPVTNGSELRSLDTGEYIGLVENRTLMIRFRIEEGALGLTIDATALTVPQLFLRGDASIDFDPQDVQLLQLSPGSYWLSYQASPSSFPRVDFTVQQDGSVDHHMSLDGFVQGRGSATLTVRGYDITIDATALTAPTISTFTLGNYPNDAAMALTLMPGEHMIQYQAGPSSFPHVTYAVLGDGNVDYDMGLDGFVQGRGSATLTVRGYDITIDATDLTASDFSFFAIGTFTTSTDHLLTFLPGSHFFVSVVLEFDVMVTESGTVDFDGSLDSRVFGRGTDTIDIQ